MPAGRPTDYDPKYCKMLIKHMASGLSYESFAGVVGTHRATLYRWEQEHGEFRDAKKDGVEQNLVFWERKGIDHLLMEKDGPVFNTTLWIFNMKNRHKWADRRDLDVKTSLDDEAKEALKKMSTAELTELVKKNLQEKEKQK